MEHKDVQQIAKAAIKYINQVITHGISLFRTQNTDSRKRTFITFITTNFRSSEDKKLPADTKISTGSFFILRHF